MTSRHKCEVTSNCGLRPYVAVCVTADKAADMAPFGAVTKACRRHVHLIIEFATDRGLIPRVKGIG